MASPLDDITAMLVWAAPPVHSAAAGGCTAAGGVGLPGGGVIEQHTLDRR
jgi:hypothetical protein